MDWSKRFQKNKTQNCSDERIQQGNSYKNNANNNTNNNKITMPKPKEPRASMIDHHLGVQRVLVANRGECAMRIMRTLNKMGITSVAVYENDDAGSLHVIDGGADILCEIESYVSQDDLINAALKNQCDSVHPGYGFLSEHSEFAVRCQEAGLTWLGPDPSVMKRFARKDHAREVAIAAGVPLTPGSPILQNGNEAIEYAKKIGYPLILKPAGGGGGIGMQVCWSEDEVKKAFQTATSVAEKAFGDGTVFMEKYIASAHHIEVQVFGDGEGKCIHLGERECSVQRRHQKVIEETPSPSLTPSARERICQCAVQLCEYVNYGSAATVEFIYDSSTAEFYFLEVNTRLQVEHGVTEMVNGLDIVEMMVRQGRKETNLNLNDIVWSPVGSSIQLRIYAEDPLEDFKPSPGLLQEFYLPRDEKYTRFETWAYAGCSVTPRYDPMIVKILQWGENRSDAISRLRQTVKKCKIKGAPNNLDYLGAFLASPAFLSGKTPCDVLNGFTYESSSFILLDAPPLGLQVQDFPGRQNQGLWRIGIPPSGPMDHLNARLANSIVGNEESAAVLEMTVKGFSFKIRCASVISVTGAATTLRINGVVHDCYAAQYVRPNSRVELSDVDQKSSGVRCYLAIRGGVDVPLYLGSRSTFVGGKLGGYQGRDLQAGDVLPIGEAPSHRSTKANSNGRNRSLPKSLWPQFPELHGNNAHWQIGVTVGPHANPDLITDRDYEVLFGSEWTVHHNSNRLGMRFEGPKLQFARKDGGEGGNHPSNIVDCAYALGTLNFTGDSPVIITHDGPSLGGFICPVTVPQSELWKAGQLKAGDKVMFKRLDLREAVRNRLEQNLFIEELEIIDEKKLIHPAVNALCDLPLTNNAIVGSVAADESKSTTTSHPGLLVRMAGDSNVLIEYGPGNMDMAYRVRLHFVEEKLVKLALPGFLETTPGVRSLQIRIDPLLLPVTDLVQLIIQADASVGDMKNAKIPSRVFYLPMTFDHSCIDQALNRYMNGVRAEAPYLPRNIDFIAEANGLDNGEQDVREMVFRASYLCMGLGDVYLGAPCAVPVDPRDRVVVPKFNPARTWTQEGTVGLGGSYMCIYPMESPGGYQLVGRTLPIWNTHPHLKNTLFNEQEPWMLRMFDQVRFYPCEEQQLEKLRLRFKQGLWVPEVDHEIFDLDEHKHFLEQPEIQCEVIERDSRREIAAKTIDEALKAEVQAPQKRVDQSSKKGKSGVLGEMISCPMNAVVCDVKVKIGDIVEEGETICMLEAMKMEFPVTSPFHGAIVEIHIEKGDRVDQKQDLMTVKKSLIQMKDKGSDETKQSLSIQALSEAYQSDKITPCQIVQQVFDQIEKYTESNPMFIHLCEKDVVMAAARKLENMTSTDKDKYPLYGVPFVVKDNIDVATIPTTAACPEFSYVPTETAPCVQKLLDAGALLIGKTNLDQFATGLVGTRSPYGACQNSFNIEYISGGSSSGSSVAVALGIASFSLGTDTAGSGRVPAMFNNIVGIKPTLGKVSNQGVVPACKSLDTVTVFALSCREASLCVEIMSEDDKKLEFIHDLDNIPTSSGFNTASMARFDSSECAFTFGVPKPEQLNFFGNEEGRELLEKACLNLEKIGGRRVEIEFEPFLNAAQALYESAIVVQRLEATSEILMTNPNAMDGAVRKICEVASNYKAMDVYKAQAFVDDCKKQAMKILTEQHVDYVVTPTAPRCYKINEVNHDPIQLNKNVGYYTNFMNLFDMSAIAVPAGIQSKFYNLPFGITISATAMRDNYLACIGQKYQEQTQKDVKFVGSPCIAEPLPLSKDFHEINGIQHVFASMYATKREECYQDLDLVPRPLSIMKRDRFDSGRTTASSNRIGSTANTTRMLSHTSAGLYGSESARSVGSSNNLADMNKFQSTDLARVPIQEASDIGNESYPERG